MGKELFWRDISGLDPVISEGPFQALQFCDSVISMLQHRALLSCAPLQWACCALLGSAWVTVLGSPSHFIGDTFQGSSWAHSRSPASHRCGIFTCHFYSLFYRLKCRRASLSQGLLLNWLLFTALVVLIPFTLFFFSTQHFWSLQHGRSGQHFFQCGY